MRSAATATRRHKQGAAKVARAGRSTMTGRTATPLVFETRAMLAAPRSRPSDASLRSGSPVACPSLTQRVAPFLTTTHLSRQLHRDKLESPTMHNRFFGTIVG